MKKLKELLISMGMNNLELELRSLECESSK
jgi:hypothetical protein